MRFQLTVVGLACATLLAGCGGGGGGAADGSMAQSISFPFPGGQALGAPPNVATVQLKATASSGGDVTYTSNTPDICTVNGVTLSLIKAGECSVTASQAGGNGYAPATETQLFGIPKSAQAIVQFRNPGRQALDTALVPLSAASSSGNPVTFTSKTPDVCAVSGNTMTKLANGMCTVTATSDGGDYYRTVTMDRNIPIGTGKAAPLTFLSGYKDKDTTNEGLIGHLGNQWWCADCDQVVSSDGSSFAFTAKFGSSPPEWWYNHAAFQMFAPGLTDTDLASPDGTYRDGIKDSGKGLRIDAQEALKFNLTQNAEWFGAANNKFNVELGIGHFNLKDGKACNVILKATVLPTAAAADYSLGLKNTFAISETCGLTGLDLWNEVQDYPIGEIKFSAVQPNGQVASSDGSYQTRFKLTGPIIFQ